eukprot:1890772-Prymnesium_polylepis.1
MERARQWQTWVNPCNLRGVGKSSRHTVLRVVQEGRLPRRAAAGVGGAADNPRDVRRPPPRTRGAPPRPPPSLTPA